MQYSFFWFLLFNCKFNLLITVLLFFKFATKKEFKNELTLKNIEQFLLIKNLSVYSQDVAVNQKIKRQISNLINRFCASFPNKNFKLHENMSNLMDAREILCHLNQMGYKSITAEQLKEFMRGFFNSFVFSINIFVQPNFSFQI